MANANIWGITCKSWNNGAVNQYIYEKWFGVPNSFTNVALYNKAKTSDVVTYEFGKARLFQMLRDSRDPRMKNVQLSVIIGRKWKAK